MRAASYDYFDLPARTEIWIGDKGLRIWFVTRIFISSTGKITVQGWDLPFRIQRERVVDIRVPNRAGDRVIHLTLSSDNRDRSVTDLTEILG